MSISVVTKNESRITPPTQRASQESGALLTVHEVAELLRVPVSWVYERTRQRGMNRLPHLKVGKYVRFRLAEVEEYLETLRSA